MKILYYSSLALGILLLSNCTGTHRKEKLETAKDKYSYAIGMDIAKTFQSLELEIDYTLVSQALEDVKKNHPMLLNDSTQNLALKEFQSLAIKLKNKSKEETSKKSIEEAETFLIANKSKEGVITTASGLQYKVLVEGSGASPLISDKVLCHYVGTLLNGTEFDSSTKRGQPMTISISGVIPGWQEVIPLMKVGGKIKAWIPSHLAYGNTSPTGKIPAGSMLIFEIELLEILTN